MADSPPDSARPPSARSTPPPSTREYSRYSARPPGRDSDWPEGMSLPPESELGVELSDNQSLAPSWFLFLFITSIAGVVYVARPFLADLVVGFVLVALFQGFYQGAVRRFGGRKWLASAAVTSLIMVVVAIPVVFVSYTIALEALSAYDATRAMFIEGADTARWQGVAQKLREAADALGVRLTREELLSLAFEGGHYLRDLLFDQVTALLNNTLSLLLHSTVTVAIVFYLFVDGPRLKRFVFDMSPLPEEEEELLVRKFSDVSRGILVGNGVGSLAQGILGGVAMWAVGLPSPVLWGAVMSLFAFLPVVGISIIVIPATVYLVVTGRVGEGLLFFAFCMGQALVLENVVKTKLIGNQTRMHDLLVFLSILGGIATFGILGLLYGPLLVIIFLTFSELYLRTYRHVFAQRFRRFGFGSLGSTDRR